MWANAQRDGRPVEYRWRPLFNAAKFDWRPLLESRSPTASAQVITSATPTVVPNLVHIRSRGASGEWVKYNEIFIYLFIYLFMPFFREFTYRSDASTDYRAWWLKRRGLAQGCAFLGFVDIAPHLGGKIPKKNNFGGVNRRFQAKLVKSKNMHIINYCIDSD